MALYPVKSCAVVAGGGAGLEEDEDDDEETGGTAGPGSRAQYVSANCVVFTHYSGDVASVVDEHFSRALSYTENKTTSSTSTQVKGKSILSSHLATEWHWALSGDAFGKRQNLPPLN
jgi:hypothetical protein